MQLRITISLITILIHVLCCYTVLLAHTGRGEVCIEQFGDSQLSGMYLQLAIGCLSKVNLKNTHGIGKGLSLEIMGVIFGFVEVSFVTKERERERGSMSE